MMLHMCLSECLKYAHLGLIIVMCQHMFDILEVKYVCVHFIGYIVIGVTGMSEVECRVGSERVSASSISQHVRCYR
jgi:hypothetical protein